MIFCSCKCVDSKAIEERVRKGHSLTQIMEETQAGSNCGRCVPIIDEHVKRCALTGSVCTKKR
ncbi:MAG: (2Fe-2S)-binding protein [Pseudobacteriovorax sp.]|nr:(2Fe-2S)-binding protein [Pseudobacteriovorax sp.]